MSTDLTPIAPNLWSVHHREASVGGMQIGTRTNVLKLPNGSLLLHAPGPLNAPSLAAIRAHGPVSHIVAPNLVHHLSLARIAAEFPEARLLAAPGLAKKVPGVRIDETLGDRVPASLADVMEMAVLEGCPALGETVFYLPESRTVLGVDLAFNLHGLTGFTRFAMWLNNANDRFCVTRLARSAFIADAPLAARSVARMLDAWEVERVIVSHGEVLESGGKDALREAWAFAATP